MAIVEYLATPGWNQPPVGPETWIEQLARRGHEVRAFPEDREALWIEIPDLHVRAYVELDGAAASAVNFEFLDHDHDEALDLVRTAARTLGWELHRDDGEDPLGVDDDPEPDRL